MFRLTRFYCIYISKRQFYLFLYTEWSPADGHKKKKKKKKKTAKNMKANPVYQWYHKPTQRHTWTFLPLYLTHLTGRSGSTRAQWTHLTGRSGSTRAQCTRGYDTRPRCHSKVRPRCYHSSRGPCWGWGTRTPAPRCRQPSGAGSQTGPRSPGAGRCRSLPGPCRTQHKSAHFLNILRYHATTLCILPRLVKAEQSSHTSKH